MTKLSLSQYLENVKRSIKNKNAKILSHQLKLTDWHVKNNNLADPHPEKIVMSILTAPWDQILSAHIRSIWALNSLKYEEAFACQIIIVKAISRIFGEMKDNWLLPVVLTVAVDIRRLAHGLDLNYSLNDSVKSSEKSSIGSSNKMEDVAQFIMRLFQLCAGDNRPNLEESKKCGMMGLANQLFKIYFQINKLNLCKPMIRAIDNMSMDDHFSIAQKVTYRYYVGRKAMFDGDFVKADEHLSFAFRHCLATNKHNKRLILIYLIPVRMLLGSMPLQSLLQKYNLLEFSEIVEATKLGNLKLLLSELTKHENFFFSCGIYLILEKLKMITYRNLFKRVVEILGTHQLPIEAFTEILRYMGIEDIDSDETECILVNLIHQGIIKGYIAHKHQKLVISKAQPFPNFR